MALRDVVHVLDDDADLLKAVGRLLRVQGFRPKLFQSPEAFFAALDDDEALCILLDVNLKGVSGIEVRQTLRRLRVSLPVIFMTADHSEVTRRQAQEAGCVAYLTKPFLAKALVAAIQL